MSGFRSHGPEERLLGGTMQPACWRGTQAEENPLQTVIPSGALDRTVQGGARNLALSILNAALDSSSSRSGRDSSE